MKIPDTSRLPTRTHRLPAPDTGPLELEARLLALVEWDVPPGLLYEEVPTVKISIRLLEARDGQAVYCCVHLDASGAVRTFDLVIRPRVHEFFAQYDDYPLALHKQLLLDAMRQRATPAQ